MKEIYFACSIRGGRHDVATYAELINHIRKTAVVLTEIFGDKALTATGMDAPDTYIWRKDTDWIKQSDGIIAEVTTPSLGVGYELRLAEELEKPTLALYHDTSGNKLSAMIEGAPGIQVVNYSRLDVAKRAIDAFLQQLDR